MMNRQITDHVVENDSVSHQLEIEVADEPGAGGANHAYIVRWYTRTSVRECRIDFQNGPVKKAGVNGVTHEALLAIIIDRLRSFQAGPFACLENAIVLTHCEDALIWLQRRTLDRIARGVEGSNKS